MGFMVWIRRNKFEVEKERKSKYRSIRRPFLCAGGIFLVSSFIVKIGFDPWGGASIDPISWNEFFSIGLPVSFLGSFVAFFIFYFWQLYTKKPIKEGPPVFMCTSCFKTKLFDNNLSCECGGKFEKIDVMKWVDD